MKRIVQTKIVYNNLSSTGFTWNKWKHHICRRQDTKKTVFIFDL